MCYESLYSVGYAQAVEASHKTSRPGHSGKRRRSKSRRLAGSSSGGGSVSTTNRGLLDKAATYITESQAWRSIFRHGYPDTPLNQSLVMMGNVFLHLHPVKVSRKAMKITYTWCLGGLSFFLF